MAIVCISNSKGGVGKTALARNVAYALSSGRVNETKYDVLALDCDPQRSLETFCNDRAVNSSINELTCVAKLDPKGLTLEIQHLAKKYEQTVIDVGGKDDPRLRQALLCSQAAIVPVVPSQEGLDALAQLMSAVGEVRGLNPNLKVFIVMNMAPSDAFDTTVPAVMNSIREEYGDEAIVCRTILRHRKIWAKCGFSASTLWEIGPYDKGTKEFDDLLEEVKEVWS